MGIETKGEIVELTEALHKHLTGPGMAPLSKSQGIALANLLGLAAIGLSALVRIADALERSAPHRAVHDPYDDVPSPQL